MRRNELVLDVIERKTEETCKKNMKVGWPQEVMVKDEEQGQQYLRMEFCTAV